MPLNDIYNDNSFYKALLRQSLLPDLLEDANNYII